MGTLERRERERQKRREDIINSAKSLFFEKGLRNTTMDDIARSVELARGTIYLYFETKEEIYAVILQEGLDILHGLIESSYDPKADPLENLLNGHDAFMKFHDDYPQYHSVLVFSKMEISGVIPDEVRAQIDLKMERMANYIASRLDEGIRDGLFRAMDTKQVALMQMGMATGFGMMIDKCVTIGSTFADRQQLRQVMHDLIANGVMKRVP